MKYSNGLTLCRYAIGIENFEYCLWISCIRFCLPKNSAIDSFITCVSSYRDKAKTLDSH